MTIERRARPTDWGGLPDESISAIQAAVRTAVADGIRDALADQDMTKAFWERAFVALRSSAQQASGRWLLDSATGLARRALWFVAIGIAVYLAGGWGALVLFIKGGGKP